jgi:hypothetical protein
MRGVLSDRWTMKLLRVSHVFMMPALPASLANRRLSGSRKRPGFSWTRVMTAKNGGIA